MDIQSTANPKVKQWMKLLSKKGRKEQKKFIVEGVSSVMEAIASAEAEIECIVYSADRGLPEALREKKGNMPTYAVSEAVLRKCTDAITPQTVFAVVEQPQATLGQVLSSNKRSLAIVCDGIQDPGNLGTIIRSADAAGASAVLVSSDSVDVFHPKVIRSTMGSIFHVPVVVTDLAEALRQAANKGIQIWAAKPRAAYSLYEVDFREDAWFIIGNEASGISSAVDACATNSLFIPMQGQAESLNAAMAATITLFEAMRQRMQP